MGVDVRVEEADDLLEHELRASPGQVADLVLVKGLFLFLLRLREHGQELILAGEVADFGAAELEEYLQTPSGDFADFVDLLHQLLQNEVHVLLVEHRLVHP